MEPQTTDLYVKLHKCTDFLLPEYIFNKQHYPTWSVLLNCAQLEGSDEWHACMGGFWQASCGGSNSDLSLLWRQMVENDEYI